MKTTVRTHRRGKSIVRKHKRRVRRQVHKGKYVYHKTELKNVPSILRKGLTSYENSLSEINNPIINARRFEKPVVLVIRKGGVTGLRKLDAKQIDDWNYNNRKKFISEQEVFTRDPIPKTAIAGILINEKIRNVDLPEDIGGRGDVSYPTRYIPANKFVMKEVKFKRDKSETEFPGYSADKLF